MNRRINKVKREKDPNIVAAVNESVFSSSWTALTVKYTDQNKETMKTYSNEYLKQQRVLRVLYMIYLILIIFCKWTQLDLVKYTSKPT